MKTAIDRILDVLAGKGDAATRQELKRPDSDLGRLLGIIQAKARHAHSVDLAAAARAALKAANKGPNVMQAGMEGVTHLSQGIPHGCVENRDNEGRCSKEVITPSIVLHRAVAAATVTTVARLYPIHLVGREHGSPTISGRIEWLPDGNSLGDEVRRWRFMLRFPRLAAGQATENSRNALSYFSGKTVSVTVSGSMCEESQTTKLYFDRDGNLLSSQEQIVLPRPLTEMKHIDVLELPPEQLHSATVAFPWVGQLLPDFQSFDRAADFVETVDRNPPDWLFHLKISQTEGATCSRFGPVGTDELKRLVDQLRLKMLDGPAGGYLLQPLEFVIGNEPKRGHSPDHVFLLPSTVVGDSYSLALVVGLMAAATGQPVPRGTLFSGGVHAESLELTQIGCLTRKLRLAMDLGEQRGNHEKLLAEFYSHKQTVNCLGPQEDRTVPGKTRLCFLPTDLDTPLESLPLPFVVEAIPDGVDALRQVPYCDLSKRIDELRKDGMLVVQVSNAFDVLGLLGYDAKHPYIREERYRYAAPFPSRVYRICHQIGSQPHQVQFNSITCQSPEGREHWEHRIACQLDRLDQDLLGVKKTVERLQVILDRTVEAVIHDGNQSEEDRLPSESKWFSGDISVVDEEEQPRRWLRVVVASGLNGACLPFFVPGDVGLVGRVIRSGRTTVIPTASTDPGLQSAISSDNLLAERYGYDSLRRYQAFLRSVSSSLHVPLKRGSQVVGVVSLYCHKHKEFQRGNVRLIEKLAKRAAVEVAFYLGSQGGTTIPLEGPGSNEELARRIAICGGQPEAAQKELCHTLMSVILQQTGAYRVGIRLLSPERQSLVDQGHLGYWADSELAQEVLLSEDTAGCYAVKSGKSYFINDTTQAYVEQHGRCVPVHYKPRQPEARSHASILIRHGSHLMGVVGVDWNRPGVIDTSTCQTLEQLADRYAVALKAFSVDSLWSLVYGQPPGDDTQEEAVPDLSALLNAVARMVGAQQGAIFLRRPDTGRYHLTASMNHRDRSGDEYWYEAGEGVTGWVLQYNRPLRVANLKDSSELKAVHPTDPPVWKDKIYDGQVRDDQNWTYLGVPIAIGNEVLGILRLANGVNDLGFSSYEQVVAMAAAAQMAGPLYARENARRTGVFRRATDRVLLAESLDCVAKVAFETLQLGLGTCASAIFLVETSEDVDSRLVRLASNDSFWNECSFSTKRGEGLCGHVWRTGGSLVFQDRKDGKIARFLAQEPEDAKFSRFQSGTCVALLDGTDVSGTFLVCREARRALTPGDCAFVEQVAQIVGHGIRLARQRQSEQST